ncbi:MAG TPA: recombinase family protein [Magnetospirillaceae bacterium]|nr:recombinase family protein [Magnetospirillaceae bacterium]
MTRQPLAIATCRVSSVEQLENNSLNRQRAAVLKAAEDLGVKIPDDGWWVGSVSSKRGTNVDRKDLKEMLDRCKKDKGIKYLIVDEPDRFMRSINEAAYFEVSFERLGVKVWYASNPELNKGDLAAKLLKFTKYISAEGSNEERQTKSIAGQTKALAEGRYPFVPKPGYKRGYERGIHEIDTIRGPILKLYLEKIAAGLITPSQALVELNKTDFVKSRSLYKMDKFRTILTDPYYAGIVEINKQVSLRNEHGLHEPLITKEQHLTLLKVMDAKKKNQGGPRKNGNPEYPMSNLISCDDCVNMRYGRLVGFTHSNGKNKALTYQKYRCRSCGSYVTREKLHTKVENIFKNTPITSYGRKALLEALDIVWKQHEGDVRQEMIRITHKVNVLKTSIAQQVEAATDAANVSIREDILALIAKKKNEVSELEEKLDNLQNTADDDKERFLQFAWDFINNMGSKFLAVSKENQIRCKNLIFPAGFNIDKNKIVYTPQVSILYSLIPNKKDLSKSEKSLLVRVGGL